MNDLKITVIIQGRSKYTRDKIGEETRKYLMDKYPVGCEFTEQEGAVLLKLEQDYEKKSRISEQRNIIYKIRP